MVVHFSSQDFKIFYLKKKKEHHYQPEFIITGLVLLISIARH